MWYACCAILILCLSGIITIAAGQTSLECLDSQRGNTQEYVSVAKYRVIGNMKETFACYMITQCSVDRLDRLKSQIKAWGGATSVAVYIPTNNHTQQMENLLELDKFAATLGTDSQYGGYLTISILFGHEASPHLWNCTEPESPGYPLYPINALRNVAMAATAGSSGTDHIPPYLLYLDVDFVPSAGLNDWIYQQVLQSTGSRSFEHLAQQGDVFVLPAFESSVPEPHTPTRSLSYILEGIKAGTVKQFHIGRFSIGHKATEYARWKKLSRTLTMRPEHYPFNPYMATYARGYEPYVIISRSNFVPYDERFRGYGFNKVLNLRWFAENGSTFYVLPGHFVVEDVHPVPPIYAKFMARFDLTPYNNAVKELALKRMPPISHNTARLLRAAGFEKVATEDPETHEKFLSSVG